ncbi:MAG: porin family protein [Bacteroidales bacterium]
MKKALVFLVLITVFSSFTPTTAQTYSIKAGLNMARISGLLEGYIYYSDPQKVKFGPLLGATVEWPINKVFSFETGLLISTKGFKFTEQFSSEDGLERVDFKKTMSLYYLNVPITAKASFKLGGIKAYGFFGPYIGLGMYGIEKKETTINGETETQKYQSFWHGYNFPYKQFDVGLTSGIGAGIGVFKIELSYDFSLRDMDLNSNENTISRYHVAGVSISYIIRNNKTKQNK